MPATPKRDLLRQSISARTVCGLLWLAALSLSAWAWQLGAQLTAARADLGARLALQGAATQKGVQDTQTVAGHDFTRHLPMASSLTTRAHTLVESTQREAAVRGVQWLAVTSTLQPTSERSLAKLEVSLTLQGSYPQVKAVLADALTRTPAVVFRQLELRRAATGGDVAAQISLMLVGRQPVVHAR